MSLPDLVPMHQPRSPFCFLILLIVLACAFNGCLPDAFADGTRIIPLTDSIRNVSNGYYQAYWELADTAQWEDVLAKADTMVSGPNGELPEGNMIKFRSERIWYEVKLVDNQLRSRQHYPGWERRIDSISRDLNIMLLRNSHRVRVSIPSADIVLGGDSLRIALIHTEGPAFDWDFTEYKPEPDRLLLTTYGNDTLPIVTDMASVGEISRQTVFRVGKHHYAITTIADDYGSIEIEGLEDARDLSLTAEIDLNFKAVPVEDLDGNATTIKRTPGRELILYFWGGYYGNEQLLRLDSLYQAVPKARREAIDIAVVSRFSQAKELKVMIDTLDFRLPLYVGTEKTCLRLNCSPYLPYFVSVNGRGRISSFHDWSGVLEERLEEMVDSE